MCCAYNNIITGVVLLVLVCIFVLFFLYYSSTKTQVIITKISSISDIPKIFARDVSDMQARVDISIEIAKKNIEKIVSLEAGQRTFENTVRALDRIMSMSELAITARELSTLKLTSEDKDIREAAQSNLLKITSFILENISHNKSLYKAFKDYIEENAKKETLSDQEQYFIQDVMDDFKRSGLELPDDQLKRINELGKEIAELSLRFGANISNDNRTISVAEAGLEGLEADFIRNLKKTDTGHYILGIDYPTYCHVMQHCNVEQTRKSLYEAYANRAYPANDQIILDMLNKRDKLSQLLGFKNFAEFEIAKTMAKTPTRVVTFLHDLVSKAEKIQLKEFERLTKELPSGVTLTSSGKLKPWDVLYLDSWYEKKYFNLDELLVSEYFPMEKTIDGLIDIYAQFFGIEFVKTPISGLWHKDVQMLSVKDKSDNKILGYLLMDLYPRPNKYTHACQETIIPAVRDGGPALAIIVTNFPPSTKEKPSLLRRNDVSTFFHEFGHALHAILGRTPLGSMSGTSVKLDFAELPSQMFEMWLFDKDILAKVSCHYKTGQSMPSEMIDTIIALKNVSAGRFITRQSFYSLLSLGYHSGPCTNAAAFMRATYDTVPSVVEYYNDNHSYASFGHLTEYGSQYYCYLWSKVLAIDVFYQVKQEGLLNREAGHRLVKDILSYGGSKDPEILIKNYLGREPNSDAFLKDIGFSA